MSTLIERVYRRLRAKESWFGKQEPLWKPDDKLWTPAKRIVENVVRRGVELYRDSVDVFLMRRNRRGRPYVQDRVRLGPNEVHIAIFRARDGSIEQQVVPNLMTYIGGTILSGAWGFEPAGITLAGQISSVAPTSTTLTDTGSLMTASNLATPQVGLAGMRAYCNAHTTTNPVVWGNIVSNTTHVITVDQWWKYAASAAGVPVLGTTPSNGDAYVVAPAGLAGLVFVGLTNNASAAAATDTTLASEITSNGLGRVMATFAHTQSNSAFNSLTLSNTFTATGTQSAQKAGLFGALTSAGADPMFFETAFTLVSMGNGDTAAMTWTISLTG